MNARALALAARPGRRARAVALTLTALAVSALALALTAAPAQAIVQPLQISMGTVFPGQTSSAQTTITIAQPAHITAAGWTTLTGAEDVNWNSVLCAPAGGCGELSSFVGRDLAAGEYTLTVTIDMPMYSADAVPVVRALGELRMVGLSSQGLALTGMQPWVVPVTAVSGLALLALGAFLLLARRRRNTEDQS